MTTRTKELLTTQATNEYIDFGFTDQRGRAIGIRVQRVEVDFVELPTEWTGCYYTRTPGHYFRAHAKVTRDGKDFGAAQQSHYSLTEMERESWIAKRVESCRKSNAKKWGE